MISFIARRQPFSIETAEMLLEQYGSPLYVYDSEVLSETIRHITQAVVYPRTRFHFASVTNGNLALLKIFKDHGWGLHANTPGDVFLGLQAGFDPREIVFSGGNLTRDEFEQMLRWQVATLNLDSLDQLRSLINVYRNWSEKKYLPRLGFRLNLPDLTGKTRTGVSPAEFPAALELTKGSELQVTGLHFYRGTGTNSTPSFTGVIAQVLAVGKQLPAWNYLDFGGGFGYAYHADRPGFEWQTFGEELTRQLSELSQPINLVIEPGRAAIARCGTLLTRVVSAKWQEDRQIVGTDTTVGNIAVLSVHGGHREVCCWKDSTSQRFTSDVCGNSTFSRDYLSRDGQLPELKAGDVLGILDVGAYGYAMSSHFLHRPRPAEVLLEEGSPRLIREREGYEVLLNGQLCRREKVEF